ncbi:MAG: hypothetical protein KF833_09685 [Verrucomicrobiae bacterium]|nr:hypothetical protein [Verrucomicrobiae bacterium]
MPASNSTRKASAQKRKLTEAVEALTELQFGPRQRNETAGYALLAMLDLRADMPWSDAQAPLRGLKGINAFVAEAYGKRRKELKVLFAGCRAGLVFVTAFENRRRMQSFLSQIAWESEVWIAEDPDHMIHFNGERFLGPYPDVNPSAHECPHQNGVPSNWGSS